MENTKIVVTAEMSVQALIDAGVVTLSQLQGFADRKAAGAKRTAAASDRKAFADEVYDIMCSEPQIAEWKNGKILKQWFPNGKSQDVEVENARKKRHSLISRALADLASDGRIVKHNKTNTASGTFYTVVEVPAKDVEVPGSEMTLAEALDILNEEEENAFNEEVFAQDEVADALSK
jgi:predicted transcriptional regulator